MTGASRSFPAQFIPRSFPRDARIVMCALAAFESDLCIEIH